MRQNLAPLEQNEGVEGLWSYSKKLGWPFVLGRLLGYQAVTQECNMDFFFVF